ncbi:PREDICTED: ammonium transporter Rh type B-B [Papilio xuthus]|uniref:Ammonium transporter Rh type B-B n=1 Tax=Papilio xuthus TaxID=66420 RepID=A0AAJ6ZHN5_PAPXU|nr:PREDICTED: ammonium transporter Rh type B-B [Papilio xuthus]XP_013172776.1 PREDICTED: ammonium transporter Rh type B-B [Papilio xuthus]
MLQKYRRMKFMSLFLFQVILMVLYFVFVKYGGEKDYDVKGFEGTHVMIFIGFGFLMTFLKKYCYSGVGFNLFLAALIIQWALLCQSWYHMEDKFIYITKMTILEADIMAATILITFGALLGITSVNQLLFIAIIETVFACFNLWLITSKFKATDVGGSLAIHTFGAYFGLAASWAMAYGRKKKSDQPNQLNKPIYSTDMTAMIGTLFLWIYWPSFNSGLTHSNAEYQRAVINTYLSLAAATVTTFIVSSCVNEEGKLDMVHVQNSTLAGGVAVGAVCNMHISCGGAIGIGVGAGFISVLGYSYLTPSLTESSIIDTCGVHNLHGMPGVYSGILSILFSYLASSDVYGDELSVVFPALSGGGGNATNGTAAPSSDQALAQFEGLIATLVIAIIGGIITGALSKIAIFVPLKEPEKYNDAVDWELPK